MKELLKKKWKQIHSEYKNKQVKQTSRPSAPALSRASTGIFHDSKAEASQNPITLPYIPESLDTGDQKRNMMIEKLVAKL